MSTVVEFPEGAGGVRHHPGYHGAFTRGTAEGAMPSGTRVVKVGGEEGDATPNGSPGVILGSMSHPSVMNGVVFYFVEWDHCPRVAVGVMGWKIAPA